MAYNDYDDDVSCFILESKLTNINEYEKWNIDVKIRLYMARLVEKLLRLSKPFVAPSTFFSLSDHTYTQSGLIKNGPIRITSEILGFFKKSLVKLWKLRNGEITLKIFKKWITFLS